MNDTFDSLVTGMGLLIFSVVGMAIWQLVGFGWWMAYNIVVALIVGLFTYFA